MEEKTSKIAILKMKPKKKNIELQDIFLKSEGKNQGYPLEKNPKNFQNLHFSFWIFNFQFSNFSV